MNTLLFVLLDAFRSLRQGASAILSSGRDAIAQQHTPRTQRAGLANLCDFVMHGNSGFPLILMLICGLPLWAQEQQPLTAINGNCRVFFTLTVASSGAQATPWLPGQAQPVGSAGTSLVIDNHQPGCYGWTVMSHDDGFSALSLAFQSAPDNTLGTGPGSWSTVTVCGTSECLGVNPIVSTTDTVTTTKTAAAWLRVNLLSKTGTGTVSGVLYGYKVNIVANGGAPTVACPGGSDTQVQYNSSGACAGTSGLTATPTRVLFADGAIGAPAMAFGSSPTLGFYKVDANNIGLPDQGLEFINSGDTTQRARLDYANWDIYETLAASFDLSFRDKATSRVYGILSGIGLTFGPFGSVISGANSAGIFRTGNQLMAIQNNGGTDVNLQLRTAQLTGCTFTTIATCNATSNGSLTYCSDCTVTSGIDDTCAGSGSGAAVSRINSVYKCRI